MNDFWSAQLGATAQLPEPAVRADGEGYRRHMSQTSGSIAYSEAWHQARTGNVAPRSIYEPAAPRTLDDYKSAPRTSPLARRPGESAHAYLARTGGLLRHADDLDEATQALLAKDRADAEAEVEGKSVSELFETQRSVNDARSASLGGTPQQGYRGVGFGGEQVVEKLGGTAAPGSICGARLPSAIEVAAQLRKAEEERLAGIPQRVSTEHLRPSGDGLIVTNNTH